MGGLAYYIGCIGNALVILCVYDLCICNCIFMYNTCISIYHRSMQLLSEISWYFKLCLSIANYRFYFAKVYITRTQTLFHGPPNRSGRWYSF